MKKNYVVKILRPSDLDDVEEHEFSVFQKKVALVVPNLNVGIFLVRDFILNFLAPKVGLETARKFPLIRSGPRKSIYDELDQALGFSNTKKEDKIWFLVPESRFPEILNYLRSQNIFKVEDLRKK